MHTVIQISNLARLEITKKEILYYWESDEAALWSLPLENLRSIKYLSPRTEKETEQNNFKLLGSLYIIIKIFIFSLKGLLTSILIGPPELGHNDAQNQDKLSTIEIRFKDLQKIRWKTKTISSKNLTKETALKLIEIVKPLNKNIITNI